MKIRRILRWVLTSCCAIILLVGYITIPLSTEPANATVVRNPRSEIDQDSAGWLAQEVGDIPTDTEISRAQTRAQTVAPRAKTRFNYAAAKRRARSQCLPYGRWKGLADDNKRAIDILIRRRTTIAPYGTLRISKNPNWRRQKSLDYSGNGHMHSLFWALPLLRVGVKTRNKRMIKRFYQLIYDWIKDNPPKKPRQPSAYGQIESGYRMLTFTCAFAGPAPKPKILLKAMKREQKVASKNWRAVNNASFHQASGIYAMGCVTGNRRYMRRGLSLLNRITGTMISADGAVREGSVSYAFSTYGWTKQEMMRVASCGSRIPAKLRRVDRIPNYLAMAIRPDRRFESIGDGHPDIANPRYAPLNSWWQFAATRGTSGVRPTSLYRAYSSGIVFGRSGWGVNQPFKNETFYSLRNGPGPEYQYHAHRDALSLTLAAAGRQLLLDPGQYRLRGGAIGSYLRGRSAHNTVSATGMKSSSTIPRLRLASSTSEGDYTAILDRPYKKSTIERKVWYDRKGGFFVVMDDVRLAKTATLYQNWNFAPDRSVELSRGAAHTSGTGANLSVISVGNLPSYRIYRGSKTPLAGWSALKYGSVTKSPSLRISTKAKSIRLVTVLIPRKSGVDQTAISATGALTATGAIVEVHTADGGTFRLQLNQRSVTRLPLVSEELEPTTEPSPSYSPTPNEYLFQ